MVLSQVAVTSAMKLDDPPLAGDDVARQLLVVDDLGAGDVEDQPAGVAQALAEVGLVGVDEEVGVEVADLACCLAADEHRRRLHPADLAGDRPARLDDQPAVQEDARSASVVTSPGRRHAQGWGCPVGIE